MPYDRNTEDLQVKSSQNIYLFSVKTTLSCKKLF